MSKSWTDAARDLNTRYKQPEPNRTWVEYFFVKLQSVLLPETNPSKHGRRLTEDPSVIPRLIAEQEEIIHEIIFGKVTSKEGLKRYANADEIKERINFIFEAQTDYMGRSSSYRKVSLPVRMNVLYEILCTDGISFDIASSLSEDGVWAKYEKCTRLPKESRHYAAYAKGDADSDIDTPPRADLVADVFSNRPIASFLGPAPARLASPYRRAEMPDIPPPPPPSIRASHIVPPTYLKSSFDPIKQIRVWKHDELPRHAPMPPLSPGKKIIHHGLMTKSKKRSRSKSRSPHASKATKTGGAKRKTKRQVR